MDNIGPGAAMNRNTPSSHTLGVREEYVHADAISPSRKVEKIGHQSPGQKLVHKCSAILEPYSEYISEGLGTMLLLTIGGGCVAQSNYACYLEATLFASNVNKCRPAVSNPNVHIAWGLAVMLGVYVASGRSAAHLNPAVTLANCIFSDFGWRKGAYYMLSQFVGAFLGGLAVIITYYGAYKHDLALNPLSLGHGFASNVSTFPLYFDDDNYYSSNIIHYIISEVLGTAILLLSINSISDSLGKHKMAACFAPVLIGLSVTCIGMSFGLLTGYAINPARDFGPRLAASIVDSSMFQDAYSKCYFLIPLLAPFIGAVVGAFIYKTVTNHSR